MRPVTTHRTGVNVNTKDDYERWYMETVSTNRMMLSLRSGILMETAWALDRLCRLCINDQFHFRAIPGLMDVLFDWPEWYIAQASEGGSDRLMLFAPDQEEQRKQRFALDSLFIMRNAALVATNGLDIAAHKKTKPLILSALHTLRPVNDMDSEFLMLSIDLLHLVAPSWVVPANCTADTNPVSPLVEIVGRSSNRSLIISSLWALHLLFSTPANAVHLSPDSPALEASLRFLPLLSDKPLADACVNYLYTHLSHPPMARAFLLHTSLSTTLKLLVNQIISEQLLENVSVTVGKPTETVSSIAMTTKPRDLTAEELNILLAMQEPERCSEWMKMMFVEKSDGELTQVDFWTLYKDRFAPYGEHIMLVASDVIKNVTAVFPRAQAMVIPGPSPRFVVRGVTRRTEDVPGEKLRCLWDREECQSPLFSAVGELYDHVLEHITTSEQPEKECLWSTCSLSPLPKGNLRAHVLTHIPSSQPVALYPEQSNLITLPVAGYAHQVSDPTTRPPPPPRSTSLKLCRPLIDPPSSALTSLLCVRVLFRTSFASMEAAPRLDADHFGYPGVVDEDGDDAQEDLLLDEDEARALKRGKRAFACVRRLLEGIQIKDDTLMSWVTEMVQAST
ncbi:hypothetical protein K488DRAFT_86847 [Vararia minispora EC-137]|uniref:Uncharacterized protein n=1 Tax=Vararia minispora EC-137 TaxID=1314806 RepID=A0ACB8QHV6_9AGAM|nr:hypothetical protein K488DRAFT_86847 [Vararia minispora EC-137]